MKKLLMIASLLVLSMAACKKDDSKPKTLEQKMLGKWDWKNYEDTHLPADDNDIYVTMNPGSYMEIKKLGEIDNFIFSGSYGNTFLSNSLDWTMLDDTHFNIGNKTYTIESLTDNQFIFKFEETVNTVKHLERYVLTKPL